MQLRPLIPALVLSGTVLTSAQAHAWEPSYVQHRVAHSHHFPADPRPLVIRGVNFRQDSDMLTHESTLILDAVAKTLKASPVRKLQVIGHTSAEGDAGYNLDLSTRRAKAVRDWLVFRGVPAESLSYVGYGEQYPLASNTLDAGRHVNRRVELAPVMVSAY